MIDNNSTILRVSIKGGGTKDYSEQDFRSRNVANWLEDGFAGNYNVVRLSNVTPDAIGDDDTQYVVTIDTDGQKSSKVYSGRDFISKGVGEWLDTGFNGRYSIQKAQQYNNAHLALDEDYYRSKAEESQRALQEFDKTNSKKMRELQDVIWYNVNNPDRTKGDTALEEFSALKVERDRLQKEYDDNPYTKTMYAEASDYFKQLAENAKGKAKEVEEEHEREHGKSFMAIAPGRAPYSPKSAASKVWKDVAKLNSDTAKLYELDIKKKDTKVGEYLDNYWDATKTTLTDVDFWSRGLSEISRNIDVKKVIDKAQKRGVDFFDASAEELDAVLTEDEKALFMAFVNNATASLERANNLPAGYTEGQSFAESLGYMAEFMLTGAVGGAVGKSMAKAGEKGLKAWIGKELRGGMQSGIRKGIQKAGKAVGMSDRAAIKAANVLYKGAVRPLEVGLGHTLVQPSTFVNMSQRLVDINDSGEFNTTSEALWTGFLDSWVENWSESFGEPLGYLMDAPFRLVGTAGKKVLGKATAQQWARWMKKNPVLGVLKDAGYHGFLEEMAEEWAGTGARLALGLMDLDKAEQFVHSQASMAASFAPLSLFGLGTSAYAAARTNKRFKEVLSKMPDIMNRVGGMTEEEINSLLNERLPMDEIADRLSPILTKVIKNAHTVPTEKAVEDYKTVIEFAQLASVKEILYAAEAMEQTQARLDMHESISMALGATPEEVEINGVKHTTSVNNKKGIFFQTRDGKHTVTTIVDEDGKTWFNVGMNGSQVLLKQAGTTNEKFVSATEYNDRVRNGLYKEDTVTLNQYLDAQIENKRKRDENLRKNKTVAQMYNTIMNRQLTNPEITLGTEENPMNGVILQTQRDGVLVRFAQPVLLNGRTDSVHRLSLEEVSKALGLEADMRTEEERAIDQADNDETERNSVRRYNTTYKDMFFEVDGETFQFIRMFSAPKMDENGNLIATVNAVNANGDSFTMQVPVETLDASLSERERVAAQTRRDNEEREETQENDGAEKDIHGNPLPMRTIAEGPNAGQQEVDERAFLEKDPEAYYAWNDKRRGGNTEASVKAVNAELTAREREIAALDEQLLTEYDPETIKALDAKKASVQHRYDILAGILNKYTIKNKQSDIDAEFLPRFMEVKRLLQSATTEEQIAAIEDQLVSLDEERLARLDETYQEWKADLQSQLDSAGLDVSAHVVTRKDAVQVMHDNGASDEAIAEVRKQIATLEYQKLVYGRSFSMGGVHIGGKVYIFAEDNLSLPDALVSYHHERQHYINNHNNDTALAEVFSHFNGDKTAMLQVLATLIGENAASIYSKYDADVLADEILAFTMERVATNPDALAELSGLGLDNELINIITKEYGRQNAEDFDILENRITRNSNSGQGNYRINESVDGSESGDGFVDSVPQSLTAEQLAKLGKEYTQTATAEVLSGASNVAFNEEGEMVADRTVDGRVRFSIRTWEDGGREALAKYLKDQVKKKLFSQAEAENMLSEMDRLTSMAKDLADGNPEGLFGQWSYELVRTKDGTEVPLLHALKDNAEYSLNIDFSTVCKKRQVLDYLMNKLIREGNIMRENLSPSDVARINQIIQSHGLEIACSICFVDSKRYNAYAFANGFLDKFNPLVASLASITGDWREAVDKVAGFNYANDAEFTNDGKIDPSAVEEIVDWQTMFGKTGKPTGLKNYQLNWSAIAEIMSAPRKDSKGKDKPSIYEAAKAEYATHPTRDGQPKTFNDCMYSACGNVLEKIAFMLSQNPSLRRLAKAEDFVASEGWTNVMQYNEDLESLWNMQKGAAGAKANEGNTQYLSDVLKKSVTKDIFDIAGYRMQSFSDFIGHMYFDYLQAFADLAARQLPGHAYTKEPSFVKLFHLMGMKINMSLVSMVDNTLPKEYAGLMIGGDGNLTYCFNTTIRDEKGNIIRQGQTFPPEEAFAFQNDPTISKTAGTILVGLSPAHIRMALNDPYIRMVIPYHKSGLPHGVALIYDINEIFDFTDSQNTTGRDKKLTDAEKKVMHKRVDNYNFTLHQLSIAQNREAAYNALYQLMVNGDASKVDLHKRYEELYAEFAIGKRTADYLPYSLSDSMEDDGFLPKAAADIYLAACEKWGYKPKFEEFADEQHYYKVLIDFSVYDNAGMYTPQRGIRFVVPENIEESILETLQEDEDINAKKNEEAEPIISEINEYLANTALREEQDRIASKPSAEVTEEEKEFMKRPLYNVGDPRNVPELPKVESEFSMENNDIRFSISDEETEESAVRFSIVEDKELLNRLNSESTIKVFRAMQIHDGKLYPPMSGKVNGEWRNPVEIGQWEQADENPSLVDDKGYFTLDKGNGKTIKARYNPYFHTSPTPLNDQFQSAQDRPELVTVEVEVPESELTSGYKAEKAKNAVGRLEWKAGVVQAQLTGTREVILSRWAKPVRIVPDSEVAQEIVKMFGDKKITMPSNVVTPSLRSELEALGVPFKETDNNGKEIGELVRAAGKESQKVEGPSFRMTQQDREYDEFFKNIWKNGFSSSSLQQFEKLLNDYEEGKLTFRRYPESVSRWFERGAGSVLEGASILLRGCPRTVSEYREAYSTENLASEGQDQERLLESWAKTKGLWENNPEEQLSAVSDHVDRSGHEAVVYFDKSKPVVYKLLSERYYGTPRLLLDRVVIHNAVFPNMKLDLIGFSKDSEGKFVFIVEQPLLNPNARRATVEERDAYMQSVKRLRLVPDEYGMNLDYESDEIFVGDINEDNIFVLDNEDNSKSFYVIDDYCRLNTPEVSGNGKYIIPDYSQFSPIVDFRITEAQDAEYMSAVESGDMKKAQRMVADAFLKAYPNTKVLNEDGTPKVVYHGTMAKFNEFDRTESDSTNELGKGMYFSDSAELAERYASIDRNPDVNNDWRVLERFEELGRQQGLDLGYEDTLSNEYIDLYNQAYDEVAKEGRVIAAYLNIETPYEQTDVETPFDEDWLEDMHLTYDGVIDTAFAERHPELGGTQYVVFVPANIKSADPVTYDENGDVIPLSKRFNPETPDFRYRFTEADYASLERNGEDIDVARIKDVFGINTHHFQQGDLNAIYDNLLNIAKTFGVSPDALSFGGTLGIRRYTGRGSASAQFVLTDYVSWNVFKNRAIEMTALQNPLDLAHEWFHALDNFLSNRSETEGDIKFSYTSAGYVSGVRPEVVNALKDMEKSMKKSGFNERIKTESDKVFSPYYSKRAYWKSKVEKNARAVELYYAMKNNSESNIYDASYGAMYPTPEEMQTIAPAIEKFFNTLGERKDANGHNVLFRIENRNQSVFVSNALTAMGKIPMKKGNAQAWINKLQQAGGLKKEEDKWLGLTDWLKEQKGDIAKEDVANFIDENAIHIEEVKYGDSMPLVYDNWMNDEGGYRNEHDSKMFIKDVTNDAYYGDELIGTFDNFDDAEEALIGYVSKINPINATRLDYTTYGLKNDREIALVVPTIEPYNTSDKVHFGDAGEGRAVAWIRFGETNAPAIRYADVEQYRNELKEIQDKLERKYNGGIAYIQTKLTEEEKRMYETAVSNFDKSREGKVHQPRVLVIDEIQSKRHQDGKEKGYSIKATEKDLEGYEFRQSDDYDGRKKWIIKDKATGKESKVGSVESLPTELDALTLHLNWKKNTVPDAPFRDNWHELAMKRMLRLAAEEGYDKIAWTNGIMQADRYNLGNTVREIRNDGVFTLDGQDLKVYTLKYKDKGTDYVSGDYDQIGVNTEGDIVFGAFKGHKMNEVVGKELANKMLAMEKGSYMAGEDLRVGIDGMKSFYDTKLVNWMNKYGKQWGVEVQDLTLRGLENEEGWHSIDVTPEMKDSVMNGQPMFRITDRTEEQKQKLFDAAKEEFGTTADFREAGYLVPDGSMLDFSDKKWGAQAGTRSVDHRDIEGRMWDYNSDKDPNLDTTMDDFIHNGAIRLIDGWGGINLATRPTKEQKNTLRNYIYHHNGEIILDIDDENGRNAAYAQYDERTSPTRILNDIDAYFEDGTKPEGTVRFRAIEITPEVRDEMEIIMAVARINAEFMKAPNGADTKLSKEQWALVRTKAFKEWFGDWQNDPENASKVLDENGEPMVVYHGSDYRPLKKEIGDGVFRERSGMFGRAVYFTNDYNIASDYADEKLDINDNREYLKSEDKPDYIYDNGYVTDAFLNIRDSERIHDMPSRGENVKYFAAKANEIKSATSNNGEFSKENDDIRFAIRGKGKTLDTASPRNEDQPTVVSSASGAKVLKEIDKTITEYEGKSNNSKTFIGDLALALGAKNHGSSSQYVTFETVSGKMMTMRIANHNAKVSTFDNHEEDEGISIVVSAKENNGIDNDGEAHVREFYYDSIKIRKSEGQPYVDILKSIKRALYSGEYKDTTGLAEVEEVNFRITPEQDAEYLSAVESGDMKKAQQMVDEAARNAGYTTKAYRVNDDEYERKVGHNPYAFKGVKPGVFFAQDLAYYRGSDTGYRAEDAKPYYLDTTKFWSPMDEIKDLMVNTWSDILGRKSDFEKYGINDESMDDRGTYNDGEEIYQTSTEGLGYAAAKNGYAGVILRDIPQTNGNYEEYTEFGVIDSNYAKSADPVTYDENGDVIPLSKRFNPENPDIRFRVSDFNDIDAARERKADTVKTAAITIGDLRFSMSRSTKQTIRSWYNKVHPDSVDTASVDALTDYLEETFDDAVSQLAAAKWYFNGVVVLPDEDVDKIKQAVEVAKKNKVDPLSFASPMAIVNQFGKLESKEKPINPDEVSTLHLAKKFDNGIAIYDVDDTMESRRNMRRIINTHFGKKCSPWCLLQGDSEGNLTDQSQRYWEHYNKYPKQVAFKDGKLIAFSANDTKKVVWWDRNDEAHKEIPILSKIPNDTLGRTGVALYSPKTGKMERYTDISKRTETEYRHWTSLDGNMDVWNTAQDDYNITRSVDAGTTYSKREVDTQHFVLSLRNVGDEFRYARNDGKTARILDLYNNGDIKAMQLFHIDSPLKIKYGFSGGNKYTEYSYSDVVESYGRSRNSEPNHLLSRRRGDRKEVYIKGQLTYAYLLSSDAEFASTLEQTHFLNDGTPFVTFRDDVGKPNITLTKEKLIELREVHPEEREFLTRLIESDKYERVESINYTPIEAIDMEEVKDEVNRLMGLDEEDMLTARSEMSEMGAKLPIPRFPGLDARSDIAKASDDPLFRFVGLGGGRSKLDTDTLLIREASLANAVFMEIKGKKAKAIKYATGWEKGKDGNWRYEEQDFTLDQLKPVGAMSRRGSLLSLIDDKDLFKMYPRFLTWSIELKPGDNTYRGYCDIANRTIVINPSLLDFKLEEGKYYFTEGARGTLIHEIQHAIQFFEGWENGGNIMQIADRIRDTFDSIMNDYRDLNKKAKKHLRTPQAKAFNHARENGKSYSAAEMDRLQTESRGTKEFKALIDGASKFVGKYGFTPNIWEEAVSFADSHEGDTAQLIATYLYRTKAGEVEARNATARMDLTPEQRRDTPAYETADTLWGLQWLHAGAAGNEGLYALDAELASDILMDTYEALPEEVRKDIAEDAMGKGGRFARTVADHYASIAVKEEFDEKDIKEIATVRDIMKEKLGLESLPLQDALWSLYETSKTVHQYDILGHAERAIVADRLGQTDAELAKREKIRDEIRFSIREDMRSASAADMYNKAASWGLNRLKESYIDQYESLNDLVEAIEIATGRKAEAYEDVRLLVNQQSSKGLDRMSRYTKEYMEPMWDAISVVADNWGGTIDDVVRYAMLKHALERNEVFAKRDARRFYQNEHDTLVSRLESEIKKLEKESDKAVKNGNIPLYAQLQQDIADKQNDIATADASLQRHLTMVKNGTAAKYHEYRENDYSGLTSLYSEYPGLLPRESYKSEEEYNQEARRVRVPKYQTVAEMEKAAAVETTDFENKVGRVAIDNLWSSVNAATKKTITDQRASGMLNKGQYDAIMNEFEFYVPLRGFADTEASDIWSYYNQDNRGGFAPPVRNAKGRTSIAENPFNWIGFMASSAIAADVKNETKMALYSFILNRPDQDIVSIRDVWFVYDDALTKAFQAVNPGSTRRMFSRAVPPKVDLTTQSGRDAYDQWEESMRQLAENHDAYRRTNKLDVKEDVQFINNGEMDEHMITLKMDGEDKVLIINGNPRAAQALNGLLNLEKNHDYQNSVFTKLLRFMSGVSTSYNPEFWISNMQRDLLFALMNTNAQGRDMGEFAKDIISPARMMKLMDAYENGTLDSLTDPKDMKYKDYYREFAEGGAITGFTVVNDNEFWEKQMNKYISPDLMEKLKNSGIARKFQNLGEAVEQMTRFAAFVQVRENGGSIVEAVNAAKEISVNFNRKGSGQTIPFDELEKLRHKDGSPLNEMEKAALSVLSVLPAYGRRYIMFFNAAIQGLNSMAKVVKKNTAKASAWLGSYFVIGMLNAVIHALLDDDDDYLDMPDHLRRNNALVGANGVYFKWALPQECRIFYAFGDMLVNHAMGRTPDKSLLDETWNAVADLLPLGSGEGVAALLPSGLQPIVDVMRNENYLGQSIYNDNRFLSDAERERMPKFQSPRSTTGKAYILASEFLNTVSGGDDWDAGSINIAPEVFQHIIEGYGGGALQTIGKFVDTAEALVDATTGEDIFGKDLTLRRTPFLNRVAVLNEDTTRNAHVTDLYYYYKGEAEHTVTKMKKYEKAGDRESAMALRHSSDYAIFTIYKKYEKRIKRYEDAIKTEPDRHEKHSLQRELDQIRKDMIREISNETR